MTRKAKPVERRRKCDGLLDPFDGKGRLRPHTIRGWWQLWSGGLCVALLSPLDLAPVFRRVGDR